MEKKCVNCGGYGTCNICLGSGRTSLNEKCRCKDGKCGTCKGSGKSG